ncbi:unnamed protein product [Cylindrotheca closterium]|uniref:Uncharacterized protein n=1 Tax=Cylindrotheca closterium TaxID=2856 RepID=A0AAD2JGC0_9STRA|nr:unnamed protein product [Cylindrotheca closterium]
MWLEADEPAKTFGILMSPCSNRKPQLVVMQGKAKAWADQIQPSFFHCYDVLPLLCTTIQETLEYPMALTFFSPQEWDQILSPVLRAALPKADICGNFPHAMVYTLISLQGVGVPYPYGLQVIKQTWSDLDSLSIHLEFDSPSLQPMRQGDQLLVDLFIDSLVDQLTLK